MILLLLSQAGSKGLSLYKKLISMQNSITKYVVKTSGAKTLIIDDDADITLIFKVGLEKNGFVVTVFNDPVEALSKFTAGLKLSYVYSKIGHCLYPFIFMLACRRHTSIHPSWVI
jgi:hypothetical protein